MPSSPLKEPYPPNVTLYKPAGLFRLNQQATPHQKPHKKRVSPTKEQALPKVSSSRASPMMLGSEAEILGTVNTSYSFSKRGE